VLIFLRLIRFAPADEEFVILYAAALLAASATVCTSTTAAYTNASMQYRNGTVTLLRYMIRHPSRQSHRTSQVYGMERTLIEVYP